MAEVIKTLFHPMIVSTPWKYLLLITVVSCIFSCNLEVSPPASEITDVTPTIGPKNTVITITGIHFSSSLEENVVTVNGKEVTVTQASNTKLKAVIPPGTGSGKISVAVQGASTTFSTPFSYLWTVSTLSGDGSSEFKDGTLSEAKFSHPQGVAVDTEGNVYVGDTGNQRIRKISTEKTVSTLAGNENFGYLDGNSEEALFSTPRGVAVDGLGNVYVADFYNHCVRKITPDGIVSTFAGDTTSGFIEGNALEARFRNPQTVAIDPQGNVVVADCFNYRIRLISPEGLVTTLAGMGEAGFNDGVSTEAMFDLPYGVGTDREGNVFLADRNNHRIRKIKPNGIVSTLTGNTNNGYVDGIRSDALLNFPQDLALDRNGNVVIADNQNHVIRIVDSNGNVSTLAGTGSSGFKDSNVGDALEAEFSYPSGVAIDHEGIIYVADKDNHRIRKID